MYFHANAFDRTTDVFHPENTTTETPMPDPVDTLVCRGNNEMCSTTLTNKQR